MHYEIISSKMRLTRIKNGVLVVNTYFLLILFTTGRKWPFQIDEREHTQVLHTIYTQTHARTGAGAGAGAGAGFCICK